MTRTRRSTRRAARRPAKFWYEADTVIKFELEIGSGLRRFSRRQQIEEVRGTSLADAEKRLKKSLEEYHQSRYDHGETEWTVTSVRILWIRRRPSAARRHIDFRS